MDSNWLRLTWEKGRESGVTTYRSGPYLVWVQARPRDDSWHWGARFKEDPWLTGSASLGEAKALCADDARRRLESQVAAPVNPFTARGR